MNAIATASPPARAQISVALAGRQNAGKTSLLMRLTGAIQRPVNFPGTSVERSEGSLDLGHLTMRVIDLPGIASLNTVSPDEELAVRFLRATADRPDVLCAVVDAGKITVELRLLEQLRQLGYPMVVALTKQDVARNEGTAIDPAALQASVGVPVVEVNALTGEGAEALADALGAAVDAPAPPTGPLDPDAIAEAVRLPDQDGARSRTDRLDAVLLHPVLGLPILALIVLGIFELIFVGAEPFIGLIEDAQGALAGSVASLVPDGALQSFLVDGLINGVGSILVFVPQIVLLIGMVSILEATGYMARAAFLLDRVMSRVGLSGRSFVPMVSSFACAVPGILAARIIDDERDRLATIVTSPLMSCSARLPVYVVLIGAFFPAAWAGVALFGMYALGIVVAAVVAWALRRSVLRGPVSTLMMELPTYQPPVPRVVMGQVLLALREFVVLAGTVIFATSIVIWVLSYYPRPAAIQEVFDARRAAVAAELGEGAAAEERLAALDAAEATAYLEQSLLARGGKAIQPAFAPAGFDWRITVGILAAFPARELIVPTLGILYSAGEADPGDYDMASLATGDARPDGLRDRLRGARDAEGRPTFNPLVALSLMVFFALCSQCVSTLGAIRRETRSWRWPLFTFAYMTALAWVAAVLVYQVGSALGLGLGGAA